MPHNSIYSFRILHNPLSVIPVRGGAEITLGIYKTFLIYRICMRRAPAKPVRACFVRRYFAQILWKCMTCARPRRNATANKHFPHTSCYTLHTSHLHFALDTSSHLKSFELFSSHLSSFHLIPSLLTCHLSKIFSTIFISSEHWSTFLISWKLVSIYLSCSSRQKALTIKEKFLAQKKPLGTDFFGTQILDTQMYLHTKVFPKYFVLQSLHKALPSITLYYKACTKHVPILFYIIKIAQNTSQYYFVLQCYKACTKPFPILHCIIKLAQSTS